MRILPSKIKQVLSIGCVLITMIFVTACERDGLAPVVELHWRSHAKQYVVRRGDTLYSIAFRYDQDYRQLAYRNNIRAPYTLHVGQIIRLKPGVNARAQRRYAKPPAKQQFFTPSVLRTTPNRASSGQWRWPAQGRIVETFVPQQGKKGINIAGAPGAQIFAANSGVVAYAGSGLEGYGNLIIIRHANQFLTAYGNNARNLVREGQFIKAGQVIAEMGIVERRYRGLHFEIRYAGQPVNPLNYLK